MTHNLNTFSIGRLMAHLHAKTINVQHIKLLVLDEADKLMSDTFRQQTL